jgi:hypothetical protein
VTRTNRSALRAWLIQQADAYAQQPSANVPLIQGTLARALAFYQLAEAW